MILIYPQRFWEWFVEHEQKFRYPSRLALLQQQHWDNELLESLNMASMKYLFAHVDANERNNTARMIISAHGKAALFETVELMVTAAPEIEGWEIVAFYPPMPAAMWTRHNYPSVTTGPEDIFFSPVQMVQVKGMYNLELYVDQKVNINWEVKGAVTQMMYAILGERMGGLYIRNVSVSDLETVSPGLLPGLLPMTKLPGYIQTDGRTTMSIDGQGGMVRPGGGKK